MKCRHYAEEKIASILKEHEAGVSVPDISRRPGLAENKIDRWKSELGGIVALQVEHRLTAAQRAQNCFEVTTCCMNASRHRSADNYFSLMLSSRS